MPLEHVRVAVEELAEADVIDFVALELEHMPHGDAERLHRKHFADAVLRVHPLVAATQVVVLQNEVDWRPISVQHRDDVAGGAQGGAALQCWLLKIITKSKTVVNI